MYCIISRCPLFPSILLLQISPGISHIRCLKRPRLVWSNLSMIPGGRKPPCTCWLNLNRYVLLKSSFVSFYLVEASYKVVPLVLSWFTTPSIVVAITDFTSPSHKPSSLPNGEGATLRMCCFSVAKHQGGASPLGLELALVRRPRHDIRQICI